VKYFYEVVKYEKNCPGKILMQDKAGSRCNTTLHWHKELEFVYMIKGTLNVNISGKSLQIKDGDFYFANSEEIHITSAIDDDSINKYIVILLSHDFMRNYCKKLDSVMFDVNGRQSVKEPLKQCFIKLIDLKENDKDDPYAGLKINAQIMNIYYILLSQCIVYKKKPYNAYVPDSFTYAKKVIEYVGLNYKNEITLNDMAALVGLTPAYFSKYFKRITESNFTQYLNNVRLEHALQDMIYDNLSVTDAALENGFANVKSFITFCKKVYGCTPMHYKKQFSI